MRAHAPTDARFETRLPEFTGGYKVQWQSSSFKALQIGALRGEIALGKSSRSRDFPVSDEREADFPALTVNAHHFAVENS